MSLDVRNSCHVQDWWWKARLGKCCYQLGMIREAEKHFLSALDSEAIVSSVLELGKVHYKIDCWCCDAL